MVLFLEETAWVTLLLHFTFSMAMVRAEQFSCSSRSLICAAGWDLGCVPQTKHSQMVFLLIKGVIQQKNQVMFNSLFTGAFILYPCSSFLLSPPKCGGFFKETNQTNQTQVCLEGLAISSYFMLTEGAGEGVLLVAEVILAESSPLFLPSLRLFSDVLWFGGENL